MTINKDYETVFHDPFSLHLNYFTSISINSLRNADFHNMTPAQIQDAIRQAMRELGVDAIKANIKYRVMADVLIDHFEQCADGGKVDLGGMFCIPNIDDGTAEFTSVVTVPLDLKSKEARSDLISFVALGDASNALSFLLISGSFGGVKRIYGYKVNTLLSDEEVNEHGGLVAAFAPDALRVWLLKTGDFVHDDRYVPSAWGAMQEYRDRIDAIEDWCGHPYAAHDALKLFDRYCKDGMTMKDACNAVNADIDAEIYGEEC